MSKKTSTKSRRAGGSSKARALRKTRKKALAVATDRKKPETQRYEAVISLPPSIADDTQIDALIDVLQDREAPVKVRFAALQQLGAAKFSSPDFPANQTSYTAALRKLLDDPNADIRRRALGVLAREKDAYAQKRLIEGLKHPGKAIVAPEKALQFLGYDPHADAYGVAREIVRNPPNALAKREALRVLAADPASAPTFEKIVRDKTESSDVRQLGAAALHMLKPARLQAQAREILLDPNDSDDMHQTSLTALTDFGPQNLADDTELQERVEELSTRGPGAVQQSARKFRAKYKKPAS